MDARTAPGHSPTPTQRIVILPNRSLSARAMVWVLTAYVGLRAVIAFAFSVAGAWMILPFAGLEAVVVVAVFYYLVCHRGNDEELVVLAEDKVNIIKRAGQSQSQYEFPRYWAQVSLERSRDGWYPSRLVVRSHGRMVEVGAAIRDEDKPALANEMKNMMGHNAYM